MNLVDSIKRLVTAKEAPSVVGDDYDATQQEFANAVNAMNLAAVEVIDTLNNSKDSFRYKTLISSGLLDSPPDDLFNSLTTLVCKSLKTPLSLIDVVDENRMYVLSSSGLTEFSPEYTKTQSWPLEASFCKLVVGQDAPLIVQDARVNDLTKSNWATLNGSAIAYMGFPIRVNGLTTIGAVCAIDTVPRDWTVNESEILNDFAILVTRLIEMKILIATIPNTVDIPADL